MDPMGSWHDVQGNRTGPLRDTGIPEHVMNYAFMDMYDAIPCGKPYHNKLIYDATTLQERSAKRRNFYASMQYIKKYPTYHDMLGTLGISAGTFNEQVKPTIYALSHCMDYADENVRFWEWNHTELLQERVLWTNDGFPVEVDGSSDQFVAGQNHSGKYKTQVVKGDLAISLAGHPLHMNFGHFGTVHDDPLWELNPFRKCIRQWEYGLGDKAYVGCPEMLTEFKGANLSPDEKEFNICLQHYRGRNEHLVSELKQSRAALNVKWRGSYSLLKAVANISFNMMALTERMRGSRYHCYGSWPVCHDQHTTPHHTTPHRTTPHCTAPHCTTPHRTTPHRTAPHRTTPHRTTPHQTAPHRTTPKKKKKKNDVR
jgi:hypothetical protein